MRVASLEARGFRNLAHAELRLGEALTVVHGANGAGKTNLLEALYFGLTGRSCRTRDARELIAFGESVARVEVAVERDDGAGATAASVSRAEGRRYEIDGAPAAGDVLDRRPSVAVFLPDRLEVVKGPPAARRAHLDQVIAAAWPARAEIRRRYGRALAQRNALLSRVRSGAASASALDAWDRELAREGVELIAARAAAVAELAEPFERTAAELGLAGARLAYAPRSGAELPEQLAAELAERRTSDLERGFSGHGPHLDELKLEAGDRSLRRYGSQGQQRVALLALLLAERELLGRVRGSHPLLLLDDVMSELDPARRELLVARVARGGQALITATEAAHVPEVEGMALVEVVEGRATEAVLG